ncbi:MAG: sigma-70 family RNA polymerase sigma factor [Clostridia bacterium]|nr:sigma-70 family RNA polymerase sigma factor [Clostridia bacterium]
MTRRLPALLAAMDVSAETNRRQRQEAFRILHIAIEKELTPRQRDCLLLYYRDQLTMQAIARELGLTKGTVCKHIQKATDRLKRAAKYARLSD